MSKDKSVKRVKLLSNAVIIAAVLGQITVIASQAAAKPLKVFILVGQSNMQRHANVLTFDSMADEFFSELTRLNPCLEIVYDSDGVIAPIIPDMIEVGLDILNPIQPACMDPAALKKLWGGQLVLLGIQRRAAHLAVRQTRRCAPRGAYTSRHHRRRRQPNHRTDASCAAHVQLDTPLENFWGMVESIKVQHGTRRGV
ncbi:MAG: hypothetical protein NT154_34110 [Verrucomicrobia bacterium]|nr:hypothetical protein [Verrucomicrobiota bacterium]